MIRLAIAGALGRTGSATVRLAAADRRFEVAAALARPEDARRGALVPIEQGAIPVTKGIDGVVDVLIDFTVADSTMAWLEVCRERGVAMVIGATGHSDEQLSLIAEAARTISVVKASNFAVGVQAILDIVGPLAKQLGDAYDVEIIETHHRHKVDAPSGTAMTLADEIASATGRTGDHMVFGRKGRPGERPPGEIGVHAVRLGETIGQHEIHFSGLGETITLRHEAQSRETFAAGALRAAAWIVGKPPGLYTMRDVMA